MKMSIINVNEYVRENLSNYKRTESDFISGLAKNFLAATNSNFYDKIIQKTDPIRFGNYIIIMEKPKTIMINLKNGKKVISICKLEIDKYDPIVGICLCWAKMTNKRIPESIKKCNKLIKSDFICGTKLTDGFIHYVVVGEDPTDNNFYILWNVSEECGPYLVKKSFNELTCLCKE